MFGLKRELKNLFYDEDENLIREATCNDNHCASPTILEAIAKRTFHGNDVIAKMTNILFSRVTDFNHYNHVLKSLDLVLFLMNNGSSKMKTILADNIKIFKNLQTFQFYKDAHEIGQLVRERAESCVKVINKFNKKNKNID